MEPKNEVSVEIKDNNHPITTESVNTLTKENKNSSENSGKQKFNQIMVITNNNNGYINDLKVRKEKRLKKKNSNVSNSSFQINLFINHDITSKFLMKVYGILLFQFIIIFSLVLIFQIKRVKDYIKNHPTLFWGFFAISLLAIMFILLLFIICPNLLRKVPNNYIILFTLTFFLGFFCAFVASFLHYQIILGAITCIISICIGSFCIGLFNKGEGVTTCMFILVSTICLFLHYGAIALIFRNHYYIFLYDTIYAILYALFISIDTLIIKESFSVDDYILAAIILTLDIIRLFLFILLCCLFRGSSIEKPKS